jgi:uncharacterized BrkB/YihY/UPF0761 family membrane protein
MPETILSSPFFTDLVLPFVLVFALIFAILDRTKILGEEKRQINAIIAFVIGLLLIAFPFPRSIITNLMPLLAVLAVVMLVFLMLYSFAGGKAEEKWIRITFGIIVGLTLIIALLILTGFWSVVVNAFTGNSGGSIAANIIFIIVVIAAVALVIVTGKKSS